MTTIKNSLLSDEFRGEAERFFQMKLPRVGVRLDREPASVGAAAFARGCCVYLRPELLKLPDRQLRNVLIHELTHVIQQGQGRVRADSMRNGRPVNDDPVLEYEALDMARRFSRGEPCQVLESGVSGKYRPVIQKAVNVGEKPLSRVKDLSESAFTILQFIKGGINWLDWAISESPAEFQFQNEYQLIAGIQTGIHGKCLLLLENLGLLVSPLKLFALNAEDLKTVSEFENSFKKAKIGIPPNIKKILQNYSLYVQEDIAKGAEFLESLDLNSRSLFQSLTQSDQIGLSNLDFTLTTGGNDSKTPSEAASFAMEYGATPEDFVNYYQLYLALIAQLSNMCDSAGARMCKAQRCLEQMNPMLYGMLRSPKVDRVVSAEDLLLIIKNWLSGESMVGYPSISFGALQVGSRAKWIPNSSIRESVSDFISEINDFIQKYEATSVLMSQNGLIHTYVIDSKEARAELVMDSDGLVTMGSYVRKKQKEGAKSS